MSSGGAGDSPVQRRDSAADGGARPASRRALHATRTLLAALWFGSGAFIAIAASAVFRAAGDPVTAGNVVGAMLTRWHYIALIAPLALLVLEWKRQRTAIVLLLFAGIVIAAAESLLDIRIASIRREPLRPHFALMHALSVILLLADIVVAATVAGKLRNRP